MELDGAAVFSRAAPIRKNRLAPPAWGLLAQAFKDQFRVPHFWP